MSEHETIHVTGAMSSVEMTEAQEVANLLAASISDAEALSELIRQREAAVELRGYERAIEVVRGALDRARAEPRLLGPTERNGRITALGILLRDLEARKEVPDDVAQ